MSIGKYVFSELTLVIKAVEGEGQNSKENTSHDP